MATYDLTSSIPSSSSLKTGDILNCPYSGTYKSITLPKGTYKLECWGAQVRNFIPCKNISGILGLYDIVNNIFYTNAGTGTFTAGPIATASWVKIGNL